MNSRYVAPITTENFQADVLERSRQVPVLLDFWADWCAPCKTLEPILEKVVEAYGGAFLVGSVDTEKERDLAYAFQVQSIPLLVLLQDGKPVDAVQGAVGEVELCSFLERHGVRPVGSESEEEEPSAGSSALQRALAAARAGDAALARQELAGIEEGEFEDERNLLEPGLQFLDVSESGPGAGPLAQARHALLAGEVEPALQALLEAVGADRVGAAPQARAGLLLCQALYGEAEDVIADYRRRLATLLY